jgi:hypothetical protein
MSGSSISFSNDDNETLMTMGMEHYFTSYGFTGASVSNVMHKEFAFALAN